MGSCQSRQSTTAAAIVVKKNGLDIGPSSNVPRQGESCSSTYSHPLPITRVPLTKDDPASSLNTGMTSMESQELLEAHLTCPQEESRLDLQAEADVSKSKDEELAVADPTMDVSTVAPLPPLDLPPIEVKPPAAGNATGPSHRRKRSEPLLEFFKSTTAASNRVMVHIETPMGIPIEEIYDGVHDGEVLGEGITGKVRLITHKETGIQRAVKRLDLSLIDDEADLERLFEEVKIMCALDHPNIVCLEEVYEGDSELYLTQELCNGGDLFDRLEDQPTYCYTEAECARLLRQIISSVSYLHSKNIIHRDLKLENFLFSDRTEHSELKMIDFGLSKHFQTGDVQFESVGTPYTVAPEVILGKGYGEKCDIWAIGVLAYLLLSGETPFGGACEGQNLAQVRDNILSGKVTFEPELWGNVSDLAIDFIKSLLVLDPGHRPVAEEVQKHPWMQLMKRNSSIGSEEEGYLDEKVVNGLVSYKEMSHTRKFLCEVLSFTLQPDQLVGLREEFEKMDVDGKGEISLACFKDALLARSDDNHMLSETEIEDIFNGLKVRNTDLSIRWHEFIAACLSQCHVDERNIKLAFDRLDVDHKGYITLKDLKNAMDFYHSTRGDLQVMWINNVLDYKSEKDHMTYDDFYKLLQLDREVGPKQIFAKSAPPESAQRRRSSHVPIRRRRATQSAIHYSLTVPEKNAKKSIDASVTFDDMQVSDHSDKSVKRHSIHDSTTFDFGKILEDDGVPELVTSMAIFKNMQDVILGASKLVEEENSPKAFTRKNSVTGTKGLLLRRETCSRVEYSR